MIKKKAAHYGQLLISAWSEIDYFYNEINCRGDF